jgi:hypothetical protein
MNCLNRMDVAPWSFTPGPGVRGRGHLLGEHIRDEFFVNLVRTFSELCRIQFHCRSDTHLADICWEAERREQMKKEKSLPEHLVELLTEGHAHIDFESAVKDWPADLQGKKPQGAAHTPWEVLEHMRLAQWDILEFTRNPKHVSPEFPAGYWPKTPAPPDDKAWNKTLAAFRSDLKAIVKIVQKKSTDLFTPFAHGDGQTVLREVLLVTDHNAYHLGELLLLRRQLGAWK